MFSCIVLSLLFALHPRTAQTSQMPERVSLEVWSVNVWLGMPMEEAIKKFRDLGYAIKATNDKVQVERGNKAKTIWFKNDQLVFADQDWLTSEKTDGIDAILEALGTLAEKVKNQSCVIIRTPISSADPFSNSVVIVCGKRSFSITKRELMDQPVLCVTERIGNMPAKVK